MRNMRIVDWVEDCRRRSSDRRGELKQERTMMLEVRQQSYTLCAPGGPKGRQSVAREIGGVVCAMWLETCDILHVTNTMWLYHRSQTPPPPHHYHYHYCPPQHPVSHATLPPSQPPQPPPSRLPPEAQHNSHPTRLVRAWKFLFPETVTKNKHTTDKTNFT